MPSRMATGAAQPQPRVCGRLLTFVIARALKFQEKRPVSRDAEGARVVSPRPPRLRVKHQWPCYTNHPVVLGMRLTVCPTRMDPVRTTVP